jgi:hypothetical protein
MPHPAISALKLRSDVVSCCVAVTPPPPALRVAGSIDGLGTRFQMFRINSLEMVAQIFTSSNPLISWLRQIEGFQQAA